jgi:hypothetical protein
MSRFRLTHLHTVWDTYIIIETTAVMLETAKYCFRLFVTPNIHCDMHKEFWCNTYEYVQFKTQYTFWDTYTNCDRDIYWLVVLNKIWDTYVQSDTCIYSETLTYHLRHEYTLWDIYMYSVVATWSSRHVLIVWGSHIELYTPALRHLDIWEIYINFETPTGGFRHAYTVSESYMFTEPRAWISRYKGKAIPVTGYWRSMGLWDVEDPTFSLDNRLTDSGEIVSLPRRSPFAHRKIPGTNFC